MVLMAWGGNHFTPLLGMYHSRVGFSEVQVDTFLAAYILGLVPGFLLSGPLSDRHGRKALVVAGLGLGSSGSMILAAGSASATAMCIGRLVCGLSVAAAMVVGTSWIKELSAGESLSTGARRASITLTAGFLIGAVISGTLAQYAPLPTVLPYVVHVCLSAMCVPKLLLARDIRLSSLEDVPLLGRIRMSAQARRRYRGIILPAAAWVFAGPALGFAVAPALVSSQAGDHVVLLATMLTVVTLGTGVAAQSFVPALSGWTGGRQSTVGIAITILGTLLLALVPVTGSLTLTVLASAVLGVAFGIGLVSGLIEVQRLADPQDLAVLTARYYAVTYIGFALPMLLAALAPWAPPSLLLVGLAIVGAICAAVTLRTTSRAGGLHLL